MSGEEKIEFVDSLLERVRERFVEYITNGQIPAEWDGIELREALKDHFLESVAFSPFKKQRRRYREYRNTRIVNNL